MPATGSGPTHPGPIGCGAFAGLQHKNTQVRGSQAGSVAGGAGAVSSDVYADMCGGSLSNF